MGATHRSLTTNKKKESTSSLTYKRSKPEKENIKLTESESWYREFYRIAGLQSHRLGKLVEEVWKEFNDNHHSRLNISQDEFCERLKLARIISEQSRELLEIGFGKSYFQDKAACNRLIERAIKIIFSDDESYRNELRASLE